MITRNASLLFLAFVLITAILPSCASSTMIMTEPSEADVYIDGAYHGTSPVKYKDRKPSMSTINLRIEKPGYETLYASVTRDDDVHVGAAITGIFLFIPWFWVLEYDKMYRYKLKPHGPGHEEFEIFQATRPKTKVEKLLELKALLDQGIITQEEFDQEKKKILDSDDD